MIQIYQPDTSTFFPHYRIFSLFAVYLCTSASAHAFIHKHLMCVMSPPRAQGEAVDQGERAGTPMEPKITMSTHTSKRNEISSVEARCSLCGVPAHRLCCLCVSVGVMASVTGAFGGEATEASQPACLAAITPRAVSHFHASAFLRCERGGLVGAKQSDSLTLSFWVFAQRNTSKDCKNKSKTQLDHCAQNPDCDPGSPQGESLSLLGLLPHHQLCICQ